MLLVQIEKLSPTNFRSNIKQIVLKYGLPRILQLMKVGISLTRGTYNCLALNPVLR